MSIFDRALASTLPDYAMRRMRAKQVVAVYEAAKASRTHKVKRETRGPNKATNDEVLSLREQARSLDQNNDLAKGALDILVRNTVGMGITPEFQVKDKKGDLIEEVNDHLAALHRDFARRPEVTFEHDEASSQRISARTLYRDGEVLTKHLVGTTPGLDHGSIVPYSYELMEPDYLPLTLNGMNSETTREIVAGIEFNGWGRAMAYHIARENPADSFKLNGKTWIVPADRMSMLKLTSRIRQARGVSVFAVVLKRLASIFEIDETEMVAARMAAAMAVYVKKGDPYIYAAPGDDEDDREIEFAPGMVIDDLQPGEDIGSIASNRPNNALIPFKDSHMRHAAGGLGVSYSSFSKNYNGTYSAQRQELVEQYAEYGVLWKYFTERSERPKIENFIKTALLTYQGSKKLIVLPPETDLSTLFDVTFSRPALPWIQPKQEADAYVTLRDAGFESTSNIIRSRGGDPRAVKKQLDQEGRNDAKETSSTVV